MSAPLQPVVRTPRRSLSLALPPRPVQPPPVSRAVLCLLLPRLFARFNHPPSLLTQQPHHHHHHTPPHHQSVLGEDLKAGDMEVGVVTAADGFKVLSTAEVDTFLTIISERD